jgi:hypothetical protein
MKRSQNRHFCPARLRSPGRRPTRLEARSRDDRKPRQARASPSGRPALAGPVFHFAIERSGSEVLGWPREAAASRLNIRCWLALGFNRFAHSSFAARSAVCVARFVPSSHAATVLGRASRVQICAWPGRRAGHSRVRRSPERAPARLPALAASAVSHLRREPAEAGRRSAFRGAFSGGCSVTVTRLAACARVRRSLGARLPSDR